MVWIKSYETQFWVLIRVGVAMLLGATIGLEREFRDKPAGLRTHILTAGAATLLVSLSGLVVQAWQIWLTLSW